MYSEHEELMIGICTGITKGLCVIGSPDPKSMTDKNTHMYCRDLSCLNGYAMELYVDSHEDLFLLLNEKIPCVSKGLGPQFVVFFIVENAADHAFTCSFN